MRRRQRRKEKLPALRFWGPEDVVFLKTRSGAGKHRDRREKRKGAAWKWRPWEVED